MPQTLSLSVTDRAVVETSLKRLIGDALGAMATIPLYCVGEINVSVDPASMVTSRHDVWHAYLVVARETLRCVSSLDEVEHLLESLSETTDDLRDTFLRLLHARAMTVADAQKNFQILEAAYHHMMKVTEEIGQHLDLKRPMVPSEQSLKKVAFSRSLQWFGEELLKVASGQQSQERASR